MQRQRRPDGALYYITGSPGAGKTTWARERVRRAARLVVWDGKGVDWGDRQGCDVDYGLHGLKQCALAAGALRLSVRVAATRENFEAFCRLAWVWGRVARGVIVVDEIADVTTPGKAPIAWGEICRKARSFGTDVYVTT